MDKLKFCINTYRKLDDELKNINAKALDIRREKKTIEADMSLILSQPDFQQYDKLEIKEDNSIIKIQRPGGWTKGWTMSKSELMEGLDEPRLTRSNDWPRPSSVADEMSTGGSWAP